MPGQTRGALGRGPYGKRQREDPKLCAGSGQALGEAGPELVLDVLGVGQVPVQFLASLLCPWDSPGKNTGVCCHALLQGIFPTQGLNPNLLCLLHSKRILDC